MTPDPILQTEQAVQRPFSKRQKLALFLAGLTIALGAVVIVGWHSDKPILIQVFPGFVPMQYNTALGFLLCGLSLVLELLRKPRWALGAGSLAGVIGVLTLIQYTGGIDLGLDELFMKHTITVKTSHPGRMAPNTALCFTLAGLSLACSRF